MNNIELAHSIISMSREITDSIKMIKDTAPEFLLERYENCQQEYYEMFDSLVDSSTKDLKDAIAEVYLRYMDEKSLMALWTSYIVGKPLEVDDLDFKTEISDVKNNWLFTVVTLMDELVDINERKRFDN